jgi:hypothetical protein
VVVVTGASRGIGAGLASFVTGEIVHVDGGESAGVG